jgi:hypothetical protein
MGKRLAAMACERVSAPEDGRLSATLTHRRLPGRRILQGDATHYLSFTVRVWRMRVEPRPVWLALLCLALALPLAACGDALVVTAGSLPLFHRTPVDMVVSAISGRDCSLVYLDMRQQYCRPKEHVPEQPQFCTRSLGVADSWEDPSALHNKPREIADGPRSLSPEQDADRKRCWPGPW